MKLESLKEDLSTLNSFMEFYNQIAWDVISLA